MFESHFGFIRRPFTAGPDFELFAENESALSAFEAIEYCLRGGQGIAVLTGPTGIGKTMLCHRLINELRDEHCISFLPSPGTSSRLGLLQAIYFGLGKRVKRRHAGISDSEMRLELIDSIRSLRVHSTGIVVIVDEAHLLDPAQLEEIRILASFTDRGQPLVRPLLSGNPELEERLLEPGLKALSQRIRCQRYLQPLTKAESIDFIRHQLVRAGSRNRDVFEEPALHAIAEAADGNPRCINQLCDQALYVAARDGLQKVNSQTINTSLEDLIQLPLSWKQPLASTTTTNSSDHSFVEIGSLEPQQAASPRVTTSVVEFGSLDGGDLAFENVDESAIVAPEPITEEIDDTVYPTRPLDSVVSQTDPELNIAEPVNEGAADDNPEPGQDLVESFRHGLPDAPKPYTQVPVEDRYSSPDRIANLEAESVDAVDDYSVLRPRFDEAESVGNLLPGSHLNEPTDGLAAHQLAAAAANARAIHVKDQWTELDQARATPPLNTEPIAVSAEEQLLGSCIETRREIATMLDTLENHVSESLADQYDIVMPEAPPELQVPSDG